ncbi:rhodanese-related sulfurtransferase [Buchnera aphidicola]|uniref:oxygen-dependent tRNA uridine(34) hydroxylase TrhO n=1 Tax=Buchnera aphidicola TaxID=9 RepID=UPI0034641792
MSLLHNIYSKKKLKSDLLKNYSYRITLSFYKYFDISDPYAFRNLIYEKFYELKILGRIYIAKEGINAQISISKKKINIFKEFLYNINDNFHNIHINYALNDKPSFWVLQVKVKKTIVADGLVHNIFDLKKSGTYLQPIQVNDMIKKKNTVVVDIRNDYEYAIGHFENAIHIPGSKFRDQLKVIVPELKKFKNHNIVMYCTGGIRCEKATSWIKIHNFQNVYHIYGGILNYINESRKKGFLSMFQGRNFVFDNRMTERVSHHVFSKCKNCDVPCNYYINCKNNYCHKLFLQCKMCNTKYSGCCSKLCKKLFLKSL